MPAQHRRSSARLNLSPRHAGLPRPGIGGYAYPRGPYGATGFPGSTPAAAKKTKQQGPDGRKDPQFRGRPTLTAPEVWARDTGPAALDVTPVRVPRPQPPHGNAVFTPGNPTGPSTYLDGSGAPRGAPARRKHLTTGMEHRMTPVFEDPHQVKTIRNDRAQRYKAVPWAVREYQPAPNPGKTGAHFDGTSQYHPTTRVYGHPDGKPIPGRPGPVTVQSRLWIGDDTETSDYYAMNREQRFTKGGTPARYPEGYTGDEHTRGGRLTGQRYFGAIVDQQLIGLDTDAYGIHRRRGPNHRPVRFEQPAPWSANYYDVPAPAGSQSPDMIHQSAKPRGTRPRAAKPVRSKGREGRTERNPVPEPVKRRASNKAPVRRGAPSAGVTPPEPRARGPVRRPRG